MDLLGSVSIDFQVSGDQAIPISHGPNGYIVRRVTLFGAVNRPNGAQGGVWNMPGQAGNSVVPPTQTYGGLTSPGHYQDCSLDTSALHFVLSSDNLYFSLDALAAAPSTATILVFGDQIP